LILINVVVYFGFQHGGITHGPRDAEVVRYGAIPYEVTHPGKHCGVTATAAAPGQGAVRLDTHGGVVCEGEHVQTTSGVTVTVQHTPSGPSTWLTLITAMFLHGSILHLLGNMLFLWIFGANVEDSMSRPRFLLFYLLGGLAAIGLQIAVEPNATVPTVGASGAIAAVLGGYILLYPRARVVTVVFIVLLFTLIELPAWAMLGLWFVEQAIFSATSLANPAGGGGGGVAYFAHVGGFVFGLLTIRLFVQRRKQVPPRMPAATV
jgi:membrane associated rhomboid family serine protease